MVLKQMANALKNENENCEWIKPPAIYKADMWKHFKMSRDRSKTKCVYCEGVFSYSSSGSTSTMTRHLARLHPTISLKCTKAEKVEKQSKATADTSGNAGSKEDKRDNSNPVCDMKYKRGSPRDVKITNALMEYIVKDMR